MSDNRLSVEISVIDKNGKPHKVSVWVNWTSDQPSKIFDLVVEMAERAELEVNDYYGPAKE